jgi:hypothetical protein
MSARSIPALCLALLVAGPAAHAADGAADALVARVVANQATRGAVIRAKLTVEAPGSDRAAVAQLRIRLRRDEKRTRLLFEVLWPDRQKGEAICIDRAGQGAVGGFLFAPPDRVTPLGDATLGRAFLDSDLTIEDLADDFWQWPSPRIAGDELVGGEPCRIVEWHPPPGTASAYARVRSWISTKKLVPLRIEKSWRDDRPMKLFSIEKTSRNGGVWVPITTIVSSPGSARRTTLEISRGDRDVEVPVDVFTPESLGKAGRKP